MDKIKKLILTQFQEIYIALNAPPESEYIDADTLNQASSLTLELENTFLIFRENESEIFDLMYKTMTTQRYNAEIETLRPMLCDDNMQINAQRLVITLLTDMILEMINQEDESSSPEDDSKSERPELIIFEGEKDET